MKFHLHWQSARRVLVPAMVLVVLFVQVAQAQVVRSFDERASFDEQGEIYLIGNTLLTCEPGGDCADVQAGVVSGNNNRPMVYVNIDAAAGFDNSSSADLTLPTNAEVLFAGLYWGGRAEPGDANRDTIQLREPGAASYQTITSVQTDTITQQGTATTRPYQGFADVTSIVQAAGNGTYYVGDLTASLGNDGLGFYGGWSLVVVVRDPDEPFRRLSVYDGAANIAGTNTETINIPGLLTPTSGPFTTHMGALVWEGDEGITGDGFRLEGTGLSDPLNPVNNFWNSSITRLGTRISAKNPDYVNQLAVDINYIDASGILGNGATTAEIEFFTDGDAYFPHALAFAVDLHVPDLVTSLEKTAVDVNGGDLLPGDIIEYTITFENTGTDGAAEVVVTDQIPAGTTYVPGTLDIFDNATGAPTGAQTDAAGDDLAEFDPVANQVVFRLGIGADENEGGLIPSGESGGVRFRVQIDDDASMYGETVVNQAVVTHIAETLTDLEFEGEAEVEMDVADPAISLSKTIQSGSPYAQDGDIITYTLVATNTGDATLENVSISDPDAVLSNCDPSGPSVTLAPTETLTCDGTYTVTQEDVDNGSFTNTATVTGTAQNDDEFSDDDSAIANATSNPSLSLVKTVTSSGPYSVGDDIEYELIATNNGNVTLTNVVVSDQLSGFNVTGGTTPCPSLAPNETCTLTGTYQVTQADVDAGDDIVNAGHVTGRDPGDNEVTDDDSVDTPVDQSPSLSLVKTVTSSGPYSVGDDIEYELIATNNGNVTLTNVVVNDAMLNPDQAQCTTLAPNATCVLQGTYQVTQDDIDAGSIVNTGTANSDETSEVDDTETTQLDQDAALAVVKELTDSPDPVQPGSVLTYTITATNTGNVTLSNVRVEDPITTPSYTECADVAPGETCTLVASYTVTQDDLNAGRVDNVATASATADGTANPPPVSDDHQVTVQFVAPPIPVPSLGRIGLWVLFGMLFISALLASRRRNQGS